MLKWAVDNGVAIIALIGTIVGLWVDTTGTPIGQSLQNLAARYPWLARIFNPRAVRLVLQLVLFIAALQLVCAFRSGHLTNDARPKTRIVLLLPTGSVVRTAYRDGERQLHGLSQFINETDGRYTEDFEFVPINSAMDPGIALTIVERELARGTRYFVSTMSRVNERLSGEFARAADRISDVQRPVLICTVTSSPNIAVKPNVVYRYFPRAQEEAELLASEAAKISKGSVATIAVDDAYGHTMTDQFARQVRGRVIERAIYLDLSASDGQIEDRLRRGLLPTAGATQPGAILIAHYGNGIAAIVNVLDRLGIRSKLFMTVPMSIRDWQLASLRPLLKYDWRVSIPAYDRPDDSKDDIIRDFTTYSLRMLVQTVNFMKNDPKLTFDESWRRSEVSTGLDVKWESNGDSVIPLRAAGRQDFSLFQR